MKIDWKWPWPILGSKENIKAYNAVWEECFNKKKEIMEKYEVIRVSGVATGVGFTTRVNSGLYSEQICQTLFDTGSDIVDVRNSEKWANLICSLLNNQLAKKEKK